MEVADAMVTTEDEAAGVGTVTAGWEDEDNEAGWRTTWDNNCWGCQWTMGGGATRGRGGK